MLRATDQQNPPGGGTCPSYAKASEGKTRPP